VSIERLLALDNKGSLSYFNVLSQESERLTSEISVLLSFRVFKCLFFAPILILIFEVRNFVAGSRLGVVRYSFK